MLGAVDIGGTKIAVGLVSRAGQLVDSVSLPSQPARPYPEALEEVISALHGLLASQGAELRGIGIGVTGRLNPGGELQQNSFLPAWSGRSPAGDLARSFGVKAAIENDADAAALAEYQWGGSAGSERLIYVTVSTGIGGGVILHGKLYRGVDGCHPEIGHHVIDPNGPACFCGANGCWERMASGSALAAWARDNGGSPDWDARAVCDLARQGNPIASRAVAREGRYLGMGLANLITLFAPDRIILGGGLMQRWNLFQQTVESILASQCGLVPWKKVQLTVSTLRQPGLLGAAAVWVHHIGGDHDF